MFTPTPTMQLHPPTAKKRGMKLGKKLRMCEDLFAALPKRERGEKSFLAICKAAGLSEEKARAHFKLALALLERGEG